MTLTLGNQVQDMLVILPRNGDFVSTLVNAEGAWDPATLIELRFSNGTTWTATIVDDEARFDVDKATVTTLITAGPTSAVLFYRLNTIDTPWAYGPVNVQG